MCPNTKAHLCHSLSALVDFGVLFLRFQVSHSRIISVAMRSLASIHACAVQTWPSLRTHYGSGGGICAE